MSDVWSARVQPVFSSGAAAFAYEEEKAETTLRVREATLPMGIKPMLLDKEEAADLYRAYTKRLAYAEPIDEEIRRAYRLIARGETVIAAMDAIRETGQTAYGLPRLAITRADQKQVQVRVHPDGGCVMAPDLWNYKSIKNLRFTWPAGSFKGEGFKKFGPPHQGGWWQAQAPAPLIPLPLRPRRALDKFHVLWEADYRPVPPGDPLLLQRIGKADLWIVVRHWDMTEVERAALATRL